jgi:hypothetical protein
MPHLLNHGCGGQCGAKTFLTTATSLDSRSRFCCIREASFDVVDGEKRAELASVKKENDVSERDFATLDRVMREKPNFLTIALEGALLFKNNRSAEWLAAKRR